jgi:hypothetical protein
MADRDRDEATKQAFNYAWNWFSLHAGQRMETFNFFLVATAFLIAAYATLLEDTPLGSLVVALVGVWIAYWFWRLELRIRQLVTAGEQALKPLEADLAGKLDRAELQILERVERTETGASTYRRVIAVIQWTIVVGFVIAAAYAMWLFLHRA